MAHTRKAAILIIDELQEKLKDQDIALAKRLEWIGKVEAQKADLLAALKECVDWLSSYRTMVMTRPAADVVAETEGDYDVIQQARAAIERAEAS